MQDWARLGPKINKKFGSWLLVGAKDQKFGWDKVGSWFGQRLRQGCAKVWAGSGHVWVIGCGWGKVGARLGTSSKSNDT